MTMTEPRLQNNQVIIHRNLEWPVRCQGTRKHGEPCREILLKGELREVTSEEIAIAVVKCPRCGRDTMLA